MKRGIRKLGLTTTMILAVAAALATGASAENYTASSYPATLNGSQTTAQVFTIQGQTVTCKTAKVEGVLTAASEQVVLTPTFGECSAFGFLEATVNMNGCRFELTSGTIHVICTIAGRTIKISAGTCEVHIPDQTPTTPKIDKKNQGGDIVITSTVEGLHVTTTSGFLCPLSAKVTETGGKFSGSIQIDGLGVSIDF